MKNHQFTADGRARWRQSAEYRGAAERVRAEVEEHYSARARRGGPLRAFALAMLKQVELARRLRRLEPPDEVLFLTR